MAWHSAASRASRFARTVCVKEWSLPKRKRQICKGALQVGPGPGQVALGVEERAEIVQAVWRYRDARGPSTCSRIARARSIVGLGPGQVALGVEESAEIVQAAWRYRDAVAPAPAPGSPGHAP